MIFFRKPCGPNANPDFGSSRDAYPFKQIPGLFPRRPAMQA
jgi:hypothetical protein